MKKILIVIIAMSLLGCESQEDTYKDMAGDGPIRYIGKCFNLNVEAKWEGLGVTWENNIDPIIENVKISWIHDGIVRDSILDRGTTSCDILNLENYNYEITAQGVDKDGDTSIAVRTFQRPYTIDHEIVRSFSTVINKSIINGNRFIMFLDKLPKDVLEANLIYTTAGGVKNSISLLDIYPDEEFVILDDQIDISKPILLSRIVKIDNTSIVLPDLEISKELSMTIDFGNLISRKLEKDDFTLSDLEVVEELDIDYSINSIEDILYLPNLKVLNLGKNRYLYDNFIIANKSSSKINSIKESKFALETMKKLLGDKITINLYNEHFGEIKDYDFVNKLPNPTPPTNRNFVDLTNAKFENSVDEDITGKLHPLTMAFDRNFDTHWFPSPQNEAPRVYDIKITLEKTNVIKGVRIANSRDSSYVGKFSQPQIVIRVSSDNVVWHAATFDIYSNIGETPGEITDLLFKREGLPEVRYIEISVSDVALETNYSYSLAEFMPFL